MSKRTLQRNKRHRAKAHGFRSRKESPVLGNRRAKGRTRLAP